jgi:hypothetical protein
MEIEDRHHILNGCKDSTGLQPNWFLCEFYLDNLDYLINELLGLGSLHMVMIYKISQYSIHYTGFNCWCGTCHYCLLQKSWSFKVFYCIGQWLSLINNLLRIEVTTSVSWYFIGYFNRSSEFDLIISLVMIWLTPTLWLGLEWVDDSNWW